MSGERHFDRIAADYDASLPAHVVEHYLLKRAEFLARLFGRGRVLDVGCGTGALMEALRARGVEVVGTDVSAGMLAVLCEKGRGASAAADACMLPFRNHQFDGVCCIALVHHLAAPATVRSGIAEMVRVTRPGGHVVIWDANERNPYWRVVMRRVPQDTGEERIVPAAELVEDLRLAGAADICVIPSGLVPDFAPRRLMGLFRILERAVERTPVLRRLTAHHLVVARKA